jgi:hypothetical protein
MAHGSDNGFFWQVFRWILFRYLAYAARKVLLNRNFSVESDGPSRWLKTDLKNFLSLLQKDLAIIRPVAKFDELPSVGNRIMVELAVITIAAYRVLCQLGITRTEARAAIADIGWDIYASQLGLASLPFRLTTRDPGKRLQRTIRLLLRFPFGASGAPGYAVKSWSEGDDIYTYFTHCPPQTFVRDLIAEMGDGGELEAFSQSWCEYDWPGADVIAGDGLRGHYARGKTLSRGDAVCDMCWKGVVKAKQSAMAKP